MSARDALAAIRERADAVFATQADSPEGMVARTAVVNAAPALVGALEAVLAVAEKWERLAESDGAKDPYGWRSHSKANQIRDAIENAMEGR